jgi:hypothetical protein
MSQNLSLTAQGSVCRMYNVAVEYYAMCAGIRAHICHMDASPADMYFCIIVASAGFDKTLHSDVVDASLYPSRNMHS